METSSLNSDLLFKNISKYFNNILDTDTLVSNFLNIIKSQINLDPHQIMHADSICSDDVNNIEYPKEARLMLGPFNMGGLDGFPFAGLTGIQAFANHVPENGGVFIFYGPHIGFTKKGEIGKLLRVGHTTPSSCCGAAQAALIKLTNNAIQDGYINDLDYQQNVIEQIFLNNKERILLSESPITEATKVMYQKIDSRIQELVKLTKFSCKHIILVGGIIINTDYDMISYFNCERFDIVEPKNFSRKDLKFLLFE